MVLSYYRWSYSPGLQRRFLYYNSNLRYILHHLQTPHNTDHWQYQNTSLDQHYNQNDTLVYIRGKSLMYILYNLVLWLTLTVIIITSTASTTTTVSEHSNISIIHTAINCLETTSSALPTCNHTRRNAVHLKLS